MESGKTGTNNELEEHIRAGSLKAEKALYHVP